jgi:hypothetical protein
MARNFCGILCPVEYSHGRHATPSVGETLSVMEAADLLGVSPQCLARLIDRREISCRAADGSVLLHDVLEYKRCRDRDPTTNSLSCLFAAFALIHKCIIGNAFFSCSPPVDSNTRSCYNFSVAILRI